MHILFCAATPFEIRPVTEWIRQNNLTGIETLVTGVGLTAATYSLTKAVLTKAPGLLLQAGVAGGLQPDRPLGSVLAVRSEVMGDLGVEEQGRFRSLFDLNLLQPDDAPWQDGALINQSPLLQQVNLPIVDAVSVNEISTNPQRIGYWREKGIGVESMEGAALHYVALQQQIPFLQIRSLSNFAGERDKGKWVMGEAIARLNHETQRIISTILNT